jgi:tetratricopeptide (TPR) repeat protein
MTSIKEEQLAEEEDKKRAAWEEKLEQRIADYARMTEAAADLAVFEENLANALAALEGDDSLGALRVVDAILSPAPVPGKDAAGKDVLVPVDPVQLQPRDESRVIAIRGAAYLKSGKKDEGMRDLENALVLDPSNRLARRTLGRALIDSGRHGEGIQRLSGELRDGHRDSELLRWLSEAYRELARATRNPRHLEPARIALEDALLERPDDVEMRRSLAILELESGRYGEAVRHLEAMRAENPTDPDHLELLGSAYLSVPDRAKAMDCLEMAARVRPPSKDGCLVLASLFEEADLPGRAAEWRSRAHNASPAEASAEERFEVGGLFARAGRADEAVLWLSAIAEGEPRHVEAQALLAPILRSAGRDDEALAAFDKVRRSRPQDGEAHLAAGRIFHARKELDQALEAFSKASALPDTQLAGLIGLAEASHEKGNLAAALRHYRRALELDSGNARCIRAVKRIEDEMRRPRAVAATR